VNKPVLGLILGGILGLLDGSTAFFSAPELRPELAGIILGSAAKGLVVGLVTGIVARKLRSLRTGALVGLGVALLLTIPIAIQNARAYDNQTYYWKIILPGALTGAMVGYATVRFGRHRASPPA
jgi:hypothetical protein